MGFKEKVDNYLEEQRRIEEAKEKARIERSLQQEAVLRKEIVEYQKNALPLIKALNKTSIKQMFEEIKAEEKKWQSAEVRLSPNSDIDCVPEKLFAKIDLTRTFKAEGFVHHEQPDNRNPEEDFYEYNAEESIGIGCEYNDEQKIQFYSTFNNDKNYYGGKEEKNICLNSDPECNQKIEKALVIELSRLRQKE